MSFFPRWNDTSAESSPNLPPSSVGKWKSEVRNWLRQMQEGIRHVGEKNGRRIGRPESTPTGNRSASGAASESPELRRLLASVYNNYQKLDDAAENKVCRRDFVFHMSDWGEDLAAFG